MANKLSGMKKLITASVVLIISTLFEAGCKSNGIEQKGSPAYIASINTWHQKRIANLKKENGWLNLAGLFWLHGGENKFGTGLDNDIVFPKGTSPGVIGSFYLYNGAVTVKINPGISVTCAGKPVKEMEMNNDLSGSPDVLSLGYLRWFVIKRGKDLYGVRLRNLNASLVKDFKGIDTYPVNEDWRLTATLIPYNPPKIISVPSIIGTTEQDTVPGSLEFVLKGNTYRLDPLEEDGQLFIIFADETSGQETYGAGRFLYTSKPDSAGKVIIDFNKAYNPPCAFTKFATCPLPPKQNYLHLKVTAGEKKYGQSAD